jgi:hypothetical protein
MDGVARARQGVYSWFEHSLDLGRRSWGRDQHGISEHGPGLSRTVRRPRLRSCKSVVASIHWVP